MYSLVKTCIRPKADSVEDSSYQRKFTFDSEEQSDSDSMKCTDTSSLQNDNESSLLGMKNVVLHLSRCVQSPSREKRTIIPSDINALVDVVIVPPTQKQFYSPLYQHSSTATTTTGHNSNSSQSKGKSKHELELISRLNDLMVHSQRWKFQSELAGRHAVPIHVLDLSRRIVSKEILRCGVLPHHALAITDLTFHEEILSKTNLPSLLDIIVELFPNIEHLNFTSEHSTTDSNDVVEAKDDDDGIVYSADDPETMISMVSGETFITNLDPPKITASAKHKKDEEEFMRRLYILYRIPTLKSINRIPVREDEYQLSSPKAAKKHADVPRKLVDLRAENKLVVFHADDDHHHDDCRLSTVGVEMILNQHFSKSPLSRVESLEHEIDDIEVYKTSTLSTPLSPMQVNNSEINVENEKATLSANTDLCDFTKGTEINGAHFETICLKEVIEKAKAQNSPSSMLPSKSSFSSAGLLLAHMKIFEGKENECKSKSLQTSTTIDLTKTNESNIIQSTAEIKKKLSQHNSRKRLSRPPPSPASQANVSRPKSQGRFFIAPNIKSNPGPVPIVPLVSLFDEESSDEDEE